MGGSTERAFTSWRAVLQRCLAHTEAVIDFGDDEEDVDAEEVFSALLPEV
jgi:tRNA U34 5-carboxymethylaminomethyl modifying GTPase MnmE/TrmE